MTQPKLRFKREDGTEFPEWEEKSIKEIAPLQRGFDLPEKERVNGEYPVVCSNGIVAYHNQYKCEGYAVITGRSGTIGNFTYLDKCRYWAHNTSLWVTDFCGNNPKFIYYFYHTIRIEQYSTGTGVPTLNRNNVHASRHYVPCFEEQQKITDFLSTIDEVITQSEAEVQNLEQQKKAAMQKIFSQEVRFRREGGTEYPQWDKKSLKDCTDFIKDGTHGTHKDVQQGYYLLSAKDVFNGNIHIGENSRIISQDDFNSIYRQYSLAVGDVILTIVGTLGRSAVITDKYVKVVFQRSVAILRPNCMTDSYFLRYTMENNSFQNELEVRKSKGAQAGVYLGSLAEIEIPFPCLEEQQKIADFLSTYDEAISYAKQELDKWKELKKGLMQQMFV